MDPAITGALVGAALTAVPAALTAWWAGRRSSKKNQLDAVANYLDTVEQAVDKWRTEAAGVPKDLLTCENIYVAHHYHETDVQSLVHAHRAVQATVFHGYTLLNLRLENWRVRECLPQIKEAIEDYGENLDRLEQKIADPSFRIDPYGDIVGDSGDPVSSLFHSDSYAALLVQTPCGGTLNDAHMGLLDTARQELVSRTTWRFPRLGRSTSTPNPLRVTSADAGHLPPSGH